MKEYLKSGRFFVSDGQKRKSLYDNSIRLFGEA